MEAIAGGKMLTLLSRFFSKGIQKEVLGVTFGYESSVPR